MLNKNRLAMVLFEIYNFPVLILLIIQQFCVAAYPGSLCMTVGVCTLSADPRSLIQQRVQHTAPLVQPPGGGAVNDEPVERACGRHVDAQLPRIFHGKLEVLGGP